MNNTDGNLHALKMHMRDIEKQEARSQAIEYLAEDIQTTMLDGKSFSLSDGSSIDLVDWFADFEAENDTLAEFLKETMAYGNGQYLRNKMTESLEAYCTELATDEIDNVRG